MSASITLAGESQIALKQSQKKPLVISKFIFANVTGLDPVAPIDRAAGKPPAGQIVQVYDIPKENAGYVNPNQVVYSAQLGSDIGDWDFNWVGLEDEDGLLFAASYVPLQQKRKNIPPQQIGNNVTRNFLVAFDGAMQLTGVKIDASTWQHDFTVRLAGIDERGRYSNRTLYGRACFFSDSLAFVKVGSSFQLRSGGAYIEGIRVALDEPYVVTGVIPVGKIWLDVCLERQLNDRVASWKVVYGNQVDYTDAAGNRHYCVPIADYISSSEIVDLRPSEPVSGALIQYFAARNGDYPNLRARGTTKEDVDLENLPNAKSDDPDTNSSEILATTAALNKLKQQVGNSMTGMVAAFAMTATPTGWLKCNGAAVSRTAFAQLFAWLGTHYGGGDGSTTFNLPDMRGLFPRGWDDGRGLDPGRAFGVYQDMMLHSHAHTASVAAVGDHLHSAWTDAQGNHVHRTWTDAQGGHSHTAASSPGIGQGAGGPNSVQQSGGQHATSWDGHHAHNVAMDGAGQHAHNVGVSASGAHTHGVTVAAAGGTETRPKNLALNYCIKY
ncbi:phage tail protein [Pseudomonas sp. ADAK2]|uniref:phage tail-collar fiber domain-containing protein n=1 Tax=unclassified Pseudomonas TaxID=196821 RepID=UPI0014645F71|nr:MULTISPECIES: phage tail protein [unclassified Pseudomonas]QJI41416.1 phage tail protein [Pseudomonas sp. ADAK7]QJI47720.1 phage tail protein [Pseudomonas sp. ADAK2]